jgi:L-asparaginase
MRPSTAISADGPLNRLNAIHAAIAPEAKGKGALIVLSDEINSARDATKTNTFRVETFRSPELGCATGGPGSVVLFRCEAQKEVPCRRADRSHCSHYSALYRSHRSR